MPGARVFAPGTIGFWSNAFSDTPQITGGFDNGILNQTVPHVIFQVYAGERQKDMLDLLDTFGCDVMIGGGKDSAESTIPSLTPRSWTGSRCCGATGQMRSTKSRGAIGNRSRDAQGRSARYPLFPYGFNVLIPYLDGLKNPEYPVGQHEVAGAQPCQRDGRPQSDRS